MNLQEIVDAARNKFNNYEKPYLHHDDEMVGYANTAIDIICRDTRLKKDLFVSRSSIGQFSTVADTLDYALNSQIAWIANVVLRTEERLLLDVSPSTAWSVGDTITGASSTYTCEVVEYVSATEYKIKNRTGEFTLGEILSNGTYTADQGAAYPKCLPSLVTDLKKYNYKEFQYWRTEDAAQPYGYCLDCLEGYITITRPDDVYIVELYTINYPEAALSATSMSTQTPDINSRWHDVLVDGIVYQMYLKRGDDTWNPQAADIYLRKFRNGIHDIKKYMIHLETKERIIAPHRAFI